MSNPVTDALGTGVWELPPLILHPFNERMPPSALLDNSKAALMLSGVIPSDGSDREELRRRVLAGRYTELRMLFFLGKDILRWVEQSLECIARSPELSAAGIRSQSLADLLTGGPPQEVHDKLVRWGVTDYKSIFRRALGLNMVFSLPPPFETLASDFLQSYHRYADALYACFRDAQPHRAIDSRSFHFELFASGEYARKLESAWGESETA